MLMTLETAQAELDDKVAELDETHAQVRGVRTAATSQRLALEVYEFLARLIETKAALLDIISPLDGRRNTKTLNPEP